MGVINSVGKIDGYATIVISPDGERGYMEDNAYFADRRLEIQDPDSFLDEIVGQIHEKDAQLLVMFSYKCVKSSYYCEDDYEDIYSVLSYAIMTENYKDYWANLLREDYKYRQEDFFHNIDNAILENDIAEWEEFYDEDFDYNDAFLPLPQGIVNIGWLDLGDELPF